MPQSSNGLLNNGQPMNLVPLANGQTAVVGQNGVVMNSLAPGSVALPAVPIQNSQGGGQTDAGIQATLTANAARDRDRDRRPRRRGSNPRVDDIPSAPAAPVPPPGSGATGNGDIASGFENWVVPRGDVSVTRQNAVFNSDSVRSLRSSVALTRGQWRWVIMIERASPRAGNAFYPDVGIMIGEQFDARMPLRAQPNCCAWDGRDSIVSIWVRNNRACDHEAKNALLVQCVNSMPIPYPRSRGGPLKDGEVIVVDLDLDARTLGFRRNGVDCGTSIRGFPGNVYLAICGKWVTPCGSDGLNINHTIWITGIRLEFDGLDSVTYRRKRNGTAFGKVEFLGLLHLTLFPENFRYN